jgi:hypothetical protein
LKEAKKEAAEAVVKNLRREKVVDMSFIEFLFGSDRISSRAFIFLRSRAAGGTIRLQKRAPGRDVRHTIGA